MAYERAENMVFSVEVLKTAKSTLSLIVVSLHTSRYTATSTARCKTVRKHKKMLHGAQTYSMQVVYLLQLKL